MTELNVQYKMRKTPQQIVGAIDSLLTESYKAIGNPEEVETLSKAVAQLPLLMGTLGYYVAEADANRDDAKDERDHYLDSRCLDYYKSSASEREKSMSMTEITKRVKIGEEYRTKQVKYLEAERIWKRLNKKWQSVDKSFDGFRSRLSVVKSDLSGSS